MRSMKWSAPPACDPATLEAKVDELHRKLDQLLSRSSGAGCPMCGVCSQHSKQQESTTNQLSAQGRLLDSLDRKVMEMRTALGELTRSIEDRCFDNVSVPVVALQRRKSLPIRTSVDEVYVRLDMPRDQKTLPNAFNVPCGKGWTAGVLIEDTEDERLKGEGRSIRSEPTELRVQNEAHKEVTKELSAVVPRLATSPSSHKLPNMAKKDEGIQSSVQKHSQTMTTALATSKTLKSKPIIMPKITVTKTSQNQTVPKATETTAAVKTTVTSPSVTIAPVTTTASSTFTSVSSNPRKLTVTAVTAPSPSVHNLQKINLGVPSATSQVLWKSSTSTLTSQTLSAANSSFLHSNDTTTKTTKAGHATLPSSQLPMTLGKTPPLTTTAPTLVTSTSNNPSTLSQKEITAPSPKPVQTASVAASQSTSQKCSTISQTSLLATKASHSASMTAPMSAATGSSLKHVHSCPESLQKFQGPGGKAESVNPAPPPFVKPGTAAPGVTGTGQLMAAGIQIRISPADRSTTQTKMPPKTCLKIIDDVPPQAAPFPHRFVTLRPSPPCDFFSINTREVLGGGRFGKVHKCTDNKTNIRLAAKIINSRSAKEREMALNEIQVMNQLSHPNILQLYDAFESKNQVVLILEYVEGGELFERIVDESSPLTELDAMVFVKQICEGIQYMHQMYVLHLDLKPENILCVNRSGHQIKIIDFGLARRYKPREKLKVSFGTPEFLAPEVVNFDFVSFPTDMWTLGVVTYMLLSGLSPFLGDDDSQTLNNVLTVNWYFDEDAFEHVSSEAKDFVSNLLIRERSGRLSATQSLKHPWLNNISEKAKHSNIVLKSQVLLKKYMARRLWKKNYIAIAAANRFKKISSSGSLTSLGV